MPRDEPMAEQLRRYCFDRDRDVARLEAELAEARRELAAARSAPPGQLPPEPAAPDTILHRMLEEQTR